MILSPPLMVYWASVNKQPNMIAWSWTVDTRTIVLRLKDFGGMSVTPALDVIHGQLAVMLDGSTSNHTGMVLL